MNAKAVYPDVLEGATIAGTKNYNDNEFNKIKFKFIKTIVIHEGVYTNNDLRKLMNYRVIII